VCLRVLSAPFLQGVNMSNSYQNEIPKACLNLKIDLHTGLASKKNALPFKPLVIGDFSNGTKIRTLMTSAKKTWRACNF
jgi:type VI secretion system protein ImpB